MTWVSTHALSCHPSLLDLHMDLPCYQRNENGALLSIVCCAGGRDSVCRVWDMRTKVQVHCLSGHDDTVASILANPTSPEVLPCWPSCQLHSQLLRLSSDGSQTAA